MLTGGGVYQRIYIPVGNNKIAWRADLAVHAFEPSLLALHGPIVEKSVSNQHRVSWYCDDTAHSAVVGDRHVSIACDGRETHYDWGARSINVPSLPTSTDTVVISDLEGNLAFFLQWGKQIGLLDANGNWAFGDGHLVILGDSVDRGRHVFDLLWALYDIEIQAERAGGKLHLILGNHEQYVLRGQLTHVEPEHLWAIEQLMPYELAFSKGTVLGDWLREKPIMLVLNDTLFLHGGISQSALDKGYDIDEWNRRHRVALDEADYEDTLFGGQAPTQYRGYLKRGNGHSIANQSLIDATLERYSAKQVVVGHTKVDSIIPAYRNRLFAVETADNVGQYLHIVDGTPMIKTVDLVKHKYVDIQSHKRQFKLTSIADWNAFFGVFLSAAGAVKKRLFLPRFFNDTIAWADGLFTEPCQRVTECSVLD